MNKNYFPGGNTTEGFFSYYKELTNHKESDYIYIIKGGPGVGKSTFMKRVANAFSEDGFNIRYYHCSSDPHSLDGIFIEKLKILFTDGTAPHITDPEFPGCVSKIINLGDFLDNAKLKQNKESIICTTKKISEYFSSAYDCLASVKPLYTAVNKMYEAALDREKFNSSLKGLIKEITAGKKGEGFKNKKQFLSAFTPDGKVNYLNETIDSSVVYILMSRPGDLTHIFLEKLLYELEMKNLKCETFYCPISPSDKIEHIIIPELDTAIVTSNIYHTFDKDGIKINTSKFYKSDLINHDISEFNLKVCDTLISRAEHFIKNAKASHDILEDFYKEAMDFSKLEEFTDNFINEIKSEFMNKS